MKMLRAVQFSEIVNPVPTWDGTLWYGGHWYSGRSPSSAYFDPLKNGRAHLGVDLDADWWDPIVSPFPGVVEVISYSKGAGHWIGIRHLHVTGRTFYSRHLHCPRNGFVVVKGQPVEAGEHVAYVGSTGASAGPHDHAELLWDVPYAPWTENKSIDIEFHLTGKVGRKGLKVNTTSVQKLLKKHGFDPGPIDGIWGEKTEAAFDAFMAASLATGGGGLTLPAVVRLEEAV